MRAIRVALSGYNALTDEDPRNYSLFTDEENILIKEHSRGSVQIDDGDTSEISHNLGYKPHVYVYGEDSTDDEFDLVNGYNIFIGWKFKVDNNKLYINNFTGTDDREARYFIFYDNAFT